MLTKKLEQLDITKKEAKIYLALLELSEANMQRICDKSKIKRTTAYEVLNSLKEKGLISTTKKDKKTYYYAESPKRIGDIIEEKKLTFNNILPQLLSITNSLNKKPRIRFFEGIGGIKEVYQDTLRYPKTEILAWASSEAITYFDKNFLLNTYTSKRLENKIWVRVIAPGDKTMEKYKKEGENILRKVKLIPKEKYNLDVEINIYGKYSIAIMSFKEEIGLIIESKKIANTLKSIFEMNWNSF